MRAFYLILLLLVESLILLSTSDRLAVSRPPYADQEQERSLTIIACRDGRKVLEMTNAPDAINITARS